MGIHVHLESFEGPLALLLHLIRKEEMDIFDINIHQITKQYLEYIKVMKKFDLEGAGEFVAMAATLIQIKSRMLLPHYNEEGEVVESEDPRKELVQKLLEYEKFKEASQKLYERPLLGRDVWGRGVKEKYKMSKEEEGIEVEENALFVLIREYRNLIRSAKKKVHKVSLGLQSIAERILEIKHHFAVGKTVQFFDLLDQESRKKHSYTADKFGTVAQQSAADQMLITFLTLLELAKVGFVKLFQNETYGDIHITPQKEVDRNILERVEDYQSEASQSSVAEEIESGFFDEENHSSSQAEQSETLPEEQEKQMGFEFSQEETDDNEVASDDDIEAEEQKLASENYKEAQEQHLQEDLEMFQRLKDSFVES